MSSLNTLFLSPPAGRRVTRLAAVALVVGLAACIRPLHGPTASGASMRDVLAAIEVEPVNAPSWWGRPITR